MKKLLQEMIKALVALSLGVFFMWFLLSFGWSGDEMSVSEQILGVVYGFVMVPLYEGIKKVMRLG